MILVFLRMKLNRRYSPHW